MENKKALEWNVFRHDINNKKIVKYNVFDHSSFLASVKKLRMDKDTFSEQLRREAQYYFWSKSEHEVIITSWPAYISKEEYERITKEVTSIESRDRIFRVVNIVPTIGDKIDIYEQLMLNWDYFVDYVWNTLS
jgi:hypothetical protein